MPIHTQRQAKVAVCQLKKKSRLFKMSGDCSSLSACLSSDHTEPCQQETIFWSKGECQFFQVRKENIWEHQEDEKCSTATVGKQ